MRLKTSIVENFKKKLDEMKERYQYQVKYFNERTEEEIHEACRKVMRQREEETNLMGEILKKDIEESIKVENQRVHSTLE